MKKMNKLGNQGFSLVELVIVVALIVILGTVSVAGISFLVSKPVEECTRRIEIALQGNRNTTMGKLSANIKFYTDGNNIMALETIDTSSKTTMIGNDVKVSYMIKGNPVAIDLGNSSNPLTIRFDRSSGSLKPQTDGGSDYVEKIIISRGNKTQTVSIERLTGRVTIN